MNGTGAMMMKLSRDQKIRSQPSLLIPSTGRLLMKQLGGFRQLVALLELSVPSTGRLLMKPMVQRNYSTIDKHFQYPQRVVSP